MLACGRRAQRPRPRGTDLASTASTVSWGSVVGRRETGTRLIFRAKPAGGEPLPERPGSGASTPRCSSSLAEHDVVREVLAGDLPGGAAVALGVGVDRLDRREDLVRGREREQALAGGERGAEAGVLGDHRPAGRQVGGAAVAEPARAQAHVLVLGDGELAAGARDVVPVVVQVDREVGAWRTCQPCPSSSRGRPPRSDASASSKRSLARDAAGRGTLRTRGACSSCTLAVERRRRATAGASCRSS